MALSKSDWKNIADYIKTQSDLFGGWTIDEKRERAWKRAKNGNYGNPGPGKDDFENACRDHGWAVPDKFFWNKHKVSHERS